MNREDRIPRSRGGICGVLLILVGLWGGLAPFAGPYFDFGYTPDRTWQYSSGRLYFTIIPGAAAVLGGLLVLATRHRGVGVFGGLLGALGGIWFVGGVSFVGYVLHKSFAIGTPIAPAGLSGQALSLREYLEQLALFTGTGLVLLLAGGLAMGRFSMISARDISADDADGYYSDFPAAQAAGDGPAATTGQYPTAPSQYPATTGQYPQTTIPGAPARYPDPPTGTFPAQQDGL